MRTGRNEGDPVVITDADRSPDDELRARKKTYAILMAFHLVGFTVAGVLGIEHFWWAAIAVISVTGPLPWVAVVLANDRRKTVRTDSHRRSPNLPSAPHRR